MDADEFACIMEGVTKSLNIDIDSDIVSNIYDEYRGSYENYTLFELIKLLQNSKEYTEQFPFNKNEIIKIIKENNLDIPPKYEPLEPTKWGHYRIRRSLDVIDADSVEFYDGSIVKYPDGQVYLIDCINTTSMLVSDDITNIEDIKSESSECYYVHDNKIYKEILVVCFENVDTKEKCEMLAEDFMYDMDYEDITIVQDRNRGIFMNEEQENYWTNHVRWM